MTKWILQLVLLMSPLMARDFEFFPGATYDPGIPTLNQLAGHSWGERISTYSEIERYATGLASASASVALVTYGKTWEGRYLHYLVIASPANMERLQEIKAAMRRLAFPGDASPAELNDLARSMPVIVWLGYGVHGNEISGPEAGLLLAYHLAAAQGDELVRKVMENTVVIVEPSQNPDGRDRFAQFFRQTTGRWPDEDPESAEHNEPWPSSRSNHYLFDLNRDWFALTQLESRFRVQAVLEWFPQVFVDLHEMGGNSDYFFAPPARPYNPELTKSQIDWLRRFGKGNGEWFDRYGFDYFTGEIFDSFYPGYGEGWPMFQGAVGMTYERGSVRGLVLRRDDETTVHFRQTVQQHFLASLSTLETAAANREQLLRNFYDFRLSAMEEGRQAETKEFIFPPGLDPNRAARLASLLVAQGIQVKRSTAPFRNHSIRDYFGESLGPKDFPAETFVVSLAQPGKRLAATLLARDTPMEPEFVEEQVRRNRKRLPDQIYDVTTWSLPLLFDVECFLAGEPSEGRFEPLQPEASSVKVEIPEARLAYLVKWGTNSAARLLTSLLRDGIRVFSSDRPFAIHGQEFPSGSLIIKLRDNPNDLYDRVSRAAAEFGVPVFPTDSAWVDSGSNFGSNQVHFLKRPRIAMAYNSPTRSGSAGALRFILEQEYGYPVTLLDTARLGRIDLARYDVLLLPDSGGYSGGLSGVLGEKAVSDLRGWVEKGGTLVAIAESARWLTDEKVRLLLTETEYKATADSSQPRERKGEEEAKDSEKPSPEQPERERPDSTPGALFRVSLDTEHWLAFGYDGDANVLVEGNRIFTPMKPTDGRNIGLFFDDEKALLSGFTWEESRRQLAGKAYLMYRSLGRGHVVAFAEDPSFRAYMDGLDLLLINALFLGPAH